MSDIFREVDEDLRRDRLLSIWQRYGGVLVAAAVAIVLVTAGSVAWRSWQASRAAEQTQALVAAIERSEASPQAGADALAAFAADAEGGRATLARLYEAGTHARAGDRAAAARAYDAVAASDAEPAYRDLATILSVMVQLEGGDAAALRARLLPLTGPDNPWRFSARELDALLAARAGDRAGAAQRFRELADDPQAPQGVRSRAAELAALHAEAR